jgi:hypothetical protein
LLKLPICEAQRITRRGDAFPAPAIPRRMMVRN